MKKELTLIIFVIVIVLGLFLSFIYYSYTSDNKLNKQACSNTLQKTYFKNDSNCAINFLCIQGTRAFKDECGCGCEKVIVINISNRTDVLDVPINILNCSNYSINHCPDQCSMCPPCKECSSLRCNSQENCESQGFNVSLYSSQRYCGLNRKNIEVCPDNERLVCGWFDKNRVKCLIYPCAQEYINSCYACSDEKVFSYTFGNCPAEDKTLR
jgi:hypothetical protein